MPLTTASGFAVSPVGVGTFGVVMRELPPRTDADRYTAYKRILPSTHRFGPEVDALALSLASGQNYVDTAELYGAELTNHAVGAAIRAAAVPRERLFLAANVWKSNYGRVADAVGRSLDALGTGYYDAAGLHSPFTDGWRVPPWQHAAAQLPALLEAGTARSLKVSNFRLHQLRELAQIVGPHVTAADRRYNVLDRSVVADGTAEYCAAHGIALVAHEVLHPSALGHPVVRRIAVAGGHRPAQVLIAEALARGFVVLVKASTRAHIAENVAAVDVRLSRGELAELDCISLP